MQTSKACRPPEPTFCRHPCLPGPMPSEMACSGGVRVAVPVLHPTSPGTPARDGN